MVARLTKPGQNIIADLTPQSADLLHVSSKLVIEAAELADPIAKYAYYTKPLRDAEMENIVEELGDMEFYMERIRSLLGITREITLQANIAKLEHKRYKDGYSNDAAIKRADKDDGQ